MLADNYADEESILEALLIRCHSQQFSSEFLLNAKCATRLAFAAETCSVGGHWIQDDTYDWSAESDVNKRSAYMLLTTS